MALKGRRLSNVTLMPAVEGISRKLALRSEKCVTKQISNVIVPGHTYMGIVSRTKNVIGYGPVISNSLFMRKPMVLGTVSADVQVLRTRFYNATQWSAAALKDLSSLTNNQLKFKQAKADTSKTVSGVSAAGLQTFRGWMTAIAYAILLDGGTLPSNHEVPAFDA